MVVHFRGCSGVENRLPRAYHSGDSAEIDWILQRVAQRWGPARRHAVGISLGGNALAKWAGERGSAATSVQACVVISAPFDIAAGGYALGRSGNRVYARMFLGSLRAKALAKIERFPGLADAGRVRASANLYEFDDAFTAPVHGFEGVRDYWQRASAKPWLGGVALPMLALNARNDPFVPESSLPHAGEVSAKVLVETPAGGGHVGFVSGAGPGPRWYMMDRTFSYLEIGQ